MIIVFGSLNADIVIPVEHLPRAGETVLGRSHSLVPGGKGGNQAVAAARAGAFVRMAGMVGRDGFADVLLTSLLEAQVDTECIGRCEVGTGCAAVCVDAAGENQIAVSGGANLLARADQVPDHYLGPDTTVLMQMEVEAEQNWLLAKRAKATGARCILSVAPAETLPTNVTGDIDLLLVNESECIAVARGSGWRGSDATEAARHLAQAGRSSIVVTLGARGAIALDNGDHWSVESLSVSPIDTTAAGDAFGGVLAAALDEGRPLPEAMHRASVAGALACEVSGAQPSLPRQEAIEARLTELSPTRRLA